MRAKLLKFGKGIKLAKLAVTSHIICVEFLCNKLLQYKLI